jgi:hypothetical protein
MESLVIKFALYRHLRNAWFTRDVLPLRNADIKAVLCLVLPSIVAFCRGVQAQNIA